MVYTVTFNPAIDYVVHLPVLAAGEVNRSSSEQMYFGGKGINVSAVLRELSVPNAALGFIAGFTGEAIEKGLKESGISCDLVKLKSGNSRINVKIKVDGETEINGQGPDIGAEAIEELFLKLDRLTDGDILVLAGSIPKSLPEDIYEQILRRLSGKDIMAVVDATGSLLRKVLPYRPFLVKPNDKELGELFGVTVGSKEEAARYAKELQGIGARNVLVSMAGEGAVLCCEDGSVHMSGVCKGTVRNSVGAGDSMVAGFIAGYLQKKDMGYALKLGTAAGGATAFSDGLADRETIFRLLGEL